MTRTRDELRKDLSAYQELAELVGALSSPIRLELIESLAQCERTVDALADVCALPVKTVSHHLQKLRNAGLVRRTARGREAVYSLRDAAVVGLWAHLRAFAAGESVQAGGAPATSRAPCEAGTASYSTTDVSKGALESLVREGRATLLDVRPSVEFEAGHIPDTRSIPLESLVDKIDELPRDRLIIAVCRGPYCRLADAAVVLLRARGFEALRYSGGMMEWRATGGDLNP